MSLEHSPARHHAGVGALPDDDEVLTFGQWVKLIKVSPRNGRRILKAPGGPKITQLSARRIGISRRNHRLWLQSRERG